MAIVAIAADASAQERKRLDMPPGLQRPGEAVTIEQTQPPGINRLVQQNGSSEPTMIASSHDPKSRRPPKIDVYNSMNGSTVGEMRDGVGSRLPNGELKGESRWTVPPAVGVVVNQPLGSVNENGSSPAALGFNAGPDTLPDGSINGVKLNARVRVPFGR